MTLFRLLRYFGGKRGLQINETAGLGKMVDSFPTGGARSRLRPCRLLIQLERESYRLTQLTEVSLGLLLSPLSMQSGTGNGTNSDTSHAFLSFKEFFL